MLHVLIGVCAALVDRPKPLYEMAMGVDGCGGGWSRYKSHAKSSNPTPLE